MYHIYIVQPQRTYKYIINYTGTTRLITNYTVSITFQCC